MSYPIQHRSACVGRLWAAGLHGDRSMTYAAWAAHHHLGPEAHDRHDGLPCDAQVVLQGCLLHSEQTRTRGKCSFHVANHVGMTAGPASKHVHSHSVTRIPTWPAWHNQL